MRKHEKEILQSTLDDEKKELNHLKAIYKKASQDISGNIKIYNDKIEILLADIDETDEYQKSVLQSQIYHRDFQKNLQKQLNAFLSDLNSEQYKSINDYIEHSYEGGYVATMYDIAQQGIPIIAPIDQKKVIKAMSIDSKISKTLYEKLGEDVNTLKKRIANNISRGIASAEPYEVIARNIANDSNVGFNKAMRIARTEGHRVHQQAAFDAQHVAKDKGADVVKQWNSVLDGRVRTTHRKLDGQLREVDDPFEMDGKKAMHPSGFGRPEEDINCRCIMLQRAKWALDEDELETLKERAAFHDLDKAEDFEDFRKKYLKATDEMLKGNSMKIGGGDIPLHSEPVTIRKIDFKNKKLVAEELLSFEKNAIKESVETALVITTEGEVVKCFGVSDRVFPDYDLGDRLKGAAITHNHIAEETVYSFSEDDLELFIKHDLETLRGCDKQYVYEFNRNPEDVDETPERWATPENYWHTKMIMLAHQHEIGYRRWKNE